MYLLFLYVLTKLWRPIFCTSSKSLFRFLAGESGHAAALRLLDTLGADLDAPRSSGETPACVAEFSANSNFARMLDERIKCLRAFYERFILGIMFQVIFEKTVGKSKENLTNLRKL